MIFLILAVLRWLVGAYIVVLFARMLISWVPALSPGWRPSGLVRELIRVIYFLTEPPLRLLRRFIPPLPLGRISLDVSFLVLYVVLIVLQALI